MDFTIKFKYILHSFILSYSIMMLNASDVPTLEQKAMDVKLYEHPYWKLLLHMPKQISEIDSENFFLASDGKTNAKNELLATLHALINEKQFNDNAVACKFPARTFWLQKQLDFQLPYTPQCKEYDALMKKIDAHSVSLIFPNAHINSPASMFGHTFLRIDSSFDSKLLSYAINYAAMADKSTENGVVFAIKGLFGGYFGQYSLLPYYDKLKEYRDTEQRDIWEYNLNLTQDEINLMMQHIWEIKDTHSFYYFFDENCSYNMLWLLEIAREGVKLRDQFVYQVTPPETIFAIENENLIVKSVYRPSKRTKLLAYQKVIQKKNRQLVKDLSLGNIEPQEVIDKEIPTPQKQLIFEAALELSEYNLIENLLTQEKYLTIFYQLSKARASLKQGQKLSVDSPENPLEGHRQLKLSLQTQFKDNGFSNIFGIRPAYHSLEDIDIGFLKGTEIKFLELFAQQKDKNFSLKEFTVLSIASISQRDDFFTPLSWRTHFAFDRNTLDEELTFNGSIGAGVSWNITSSENYFYYFIDGGVYDNSKTTSSVGNSIGIVLYPQAKFKTNIELTQKLYNNSDTQTLGNLTQSYQISKNLALQIKYEHTQRYQQDNNTITAGLNLFF